MINLLLLILSGAAFSIGNIQAGSFWSKRLGFTELNSPIIIRWGLGFVTLTFLLTLAGCLGFYRPSAMWIILACWFFFSIVYFLQNRHRLFPWLAEIQRDPQSLIIYSIVFILVICLGTVLTPETRHDPYDYHLSVPNTYLAHGKIIEMTWHVFSYMPKNGEILYGLALGIGNDSLAKLMHFLFGIGCLLAIGTFVQRALNRRIALLAVFFVVTLPLFSFIGTAAYIDLIRSFWELLALLVLYITWEEKDAAQQKKLLCLSALFAGMVIGTKYTAWLIFAGPYFTLFLITIIYRIKTKSLPVLLSSLLLLVLSVSPWLVFNAIWTGNPMYPFFPSIFGIHTPSAMDAYQFIRGHAPDKTQLFSLKIIGYFFERFNNLLTDGNVHVLLGFISLGILPFIHKFSKQPALPIHLYKGLFIFIVFSFICFFLGSNNMDGRFCFSTLALLCIPLALAISIMEELTLQLKTWYSKLVPGLILLLFINALWYRYITLDNMKETLWPKITDSQREIHLQQHFPSYPFMEWCNRNLPEDAYLLGMGYPVKRKCIYGTKHGYIPFLENIPPTISAGELAQILNRAGITHLVKPYPKTQYTIPWENLEKSCLSPIFSYKTSTIYKIIPQGNG